MADEKRYVRTDEQGVMRVGQTRVMLDSVIGSWEQGYSAETIREQYPSLSLEEVYGAITYCLAHPEEIQEYVRRQDAVWAEARAEGERNLPPVVIRLRKLKAQLEAKLAEAVHSPLSPMTAADFEEVEREGTRILRERCRGWSRQ